MLKLYVTVQKPKPYAAMFGGVSTAIMHLQ